MKKFIYTLAILAVATVLHSCVKDDAECLDILDGQGAVSLNLGLAGDTRATTGKGVTANAYPGSSSDIRIYSDAGLVRHYTSLNDVPDEIWMVAGSYNAKVTLGDKISPTFDHPYFYGEAQLKIEAGKTSDAEVLCKLQNTAIKVNFDNSVTENFKAYSVKVMVGDKFDEKGACLTYDQSTKDKDGYFIVPENANRISFKFEGTLQNGGTYSKEYNDIELDNTKLIGHRHTVNLKYTPPVSGNEDGYISWNVKVSVNPIDEKEDIWGINPAPRPSIGTEDGSDVKEPVNIGAEGVSYIINSPSGVIKTIELKLNNGQPVKVEDCLTAGDKGNGVTIEFVDDTDAATRADEAGGSQNIKLILKPEFFKSLDEAGEYSLNIKAYTSDTVYGEITSQVRIEGIYSIEADSWNGAAEIKAFAFGASVKIEYQKQGAGSWTDGSAKSDADGSYSAVIAIEAGTTYLYRVTSDGKAVGETKTLQTEAGVQIPNGGFEEWSAESSNFKSPFIGTKWWHTGNKGSTTAGATYWITEPRNDVHDGSSGSTSAYLRTVNVLGFKLAAGNIFIGNFIGTIGMSGGAVAFGRPFAYNFKPKKLRFWVKGNAGSNDTNNLYILLCDIGGPHVVNTTQESTLLEIDNIKEISYCSQYDTDSATTPKDGVDPNDKKGNVVAWANWDNTANIGDWKMVEIELNYNSKDIIPNYLIINATSSKRGDYFEGSTDSYIYLDDIEFVY